MPACANFAHERSTFLSFSFLRSAARERATFRHSTLTESVGRVSEDRRCLTVAALHDRKDYSASPWPELTTTASSALSRSASIFATTLRVLLTACLASSHCAMNSASEGVTRFFRHIRTIAA